MGAQGGVNEAFLEGMNVTIPYKEEVIQYLDTLDKTAEEIGAVNTIKFTKRGNLKGYNTDVVGFENSIFPYLKIHHKFALILGTGGASKAVAYALKKNNIKYKFVSRKPTGKKEISYQESNGKRKSLSFEFPNEDTTGRSFWEFLMK